MEMSENLKERFSAVSNWKNIIQIVCISSFIVGLKSDGTVVCVEPPCIMHPEYDYNLDFSTWEDIVMISVMDGGVYGLKNDGTVIAVYKEGANKNGKYNIPSNWTDIAYIFPNCGIVINSDGVMIDKKGNIIEVENAIYVGYSFGSPGFGDSFYCLRNDGSIWLEKNDVGNFLYGKTDIWVP